jgi:hypothetical protein
VTSAMPTPIRIGASGPDSPAIIAIAPPAPKSDPLPVTAPEPRRYARKSATRPPRRPESRTLPCPINNGTTAHLGDARRVPFRAGVGQYDARKVKEPRE